MDDITPRIKEVYKKHLTDVQTQVLGYEPTEDEADQFSQTNYRGKTFITRNGVPIGESKFSFGEKEPGFVTIHFDFIPLPYPLIIPLLSFED
jgi:hypothetical protein